MFFLILSTAYPIEVIRHGSSELIVPAGPRKRLRLESVLVSCFQPEDTSIGGHMNPQIMVVEDERIVAADLEIRLDRKSTRLNSSHLGISYAVFCLKKKRL